MPRRKPEGHLISRSNKVSLLNSNDLRAVTEVPQGNNRYMTQPGGSGLNMIRVSAKRLIVGNKSALARRSGGLSSARREGHRVFAAGEFYNSQGL